MTTHNKTVDKGPPAREKGGNLCHAFRLRVSTDILGCPVENEAMAVGPLPYTEGKRAALKLRQLSRRTIDLLEFEF